MPTYKPTIINGDLVLTGDTTYESDLIVKGNIYGKDGNMYNLTVKGNILAWKIDAKDIFAKNIYADDITANNISYYIAFYAYHNLKCNSIRGRHKNAKHYFLNKR